VFGLYLFVLKLIDEGSTVPRRVGVYYFFELYFIKPISFLLLMMMMIIMIIIIIIQSGHRICTRHRIFITESTTYSILQNVVGLSIPVPLRSLPVQLQFTNVVTVRNNVMKAEEKGRTTANGECYDHALVAFQWS